MKPLVAERLNGLVLLAMAEMRSLEVPPSANDRERRDAFERYGSERYCRPYRPFPMPDRYDDAAERMLAAFRDIAAENPGGEVLVVSHGGVIRAVRRLLGVASGHMPNLGASWFTVRDANVVAGDVVRLVDTGTTGTAL